MTHQDDLILSFVVLFICIGLGALSYYQANKPWTKMTPRMVPWMPIMLGCAATGLMVIVHLANLLGFETGGGMPGGFSAGR